MDERLAARVNVYVAEYNRLGTEILNRLAAQSQLFIYALGLMTAAGTAIAGVFQGDWIGQAYRPIAVVLILLAFSLLMAALSSMYFEHEVMIHAIGSYLYHEQRRRVRREVGGTGLFRSVLGFQYLPPTTRAAHSTYVGTRIWVFTAPNFVPPLILLALVPAAGAWAAQHGVFGARAAAVSALPRIAGAQLLIALLATLGVFAGLRRFRASLHWLHQTARYNDARFRAKHLRRARAGAGAAAAPSTDPARPTASSEQLLGPEVRVPPDTGSHRARVRAYRNVQRRWRASARFIPAGVRSQLVEEGLVPVLPAPDRGRAPRASAFAAPHSSAQAGPPAQHVVRDYTPAPAVPRPAVYLTATYVRDREWWGATDRAVYQQLLDFERDAARHPFASARPSLARRVGAWLRRQLPAPVPETPPLSRDEPMAVGERIDAGAQAAGPTYWTRRLAPSADSMQLVVYRVFRDAIVLVGARQSRDRQVPSRAPQHATGGGAPAP